MRYIIAMTAAFAAAELVFAMLTLLLPHRLSAQLRLTSDGLFLHIRSFSIIPRCIRLEVTLENMYTGEICKVRLPKAFAGRRGADFYLDAGNMSCGVISAEITKAAVGVCTFIFSKKSDLSAADSILIMPEAMPVTALLRSFSEESADKRNPIGIPLGVREYSSGDRLRDIHMKLSAKSGKYMVRERFGDGNGMAVISLEAASDCVTAEKNASLLLGAVMSVLSAGGSCRVLAGGADVLISGKWELEKSFYGIFSGFAVKSEPKEFDERLYKCSLKISGGEAVVQ